MGFVDIHSHILYGLDDGARTLEQSVEMLELAARSGTTDMVATPHANGRYVFNSTLIERRIVELSVKTTVRLFPGCDFHLQFDNIQDALANPERYTINHGVYLLVEFPELGTFSEAGTILTELLGAGMVPIISHPERNAYLSRRLDDIARWVERGCFVQVTASSYTGQFGRAAKASAHELLKRGLTHFVASDAHDPEHRPPNLQVAYTLLADQWGDDVIDPLFFDNPRAVLTGDSIDLESMSAHRIKRRKWYRFWA